MAQCDQNKQASLCWAMYLSNWGKGFLRLAQEDPCLEEHGNARQRAKH